MRKKIPQRVLISFFLSFFILFFYAGIVLAEEPSKLKNVTLKKTSEGFQLVLENSKTPADLKIEETDKPPALSLYIRGARISFKKYEGIPIEVPVEDELIKRIIFEEKTDYRQTPSEYVKVTLESNKPFGHVINSQWNGQFISVTILPKETVQKKNSLNKPDKVKVTVSERETEHSTSLKVEEVEKFEESRLKKEKEHLEAVLAEKKQKVADKETQERVEEVRKEAEKRVKTGSAIEEAYKKLKAETEKKETIPLQQQIEEKKIYQDVSLPTEVRPLIRKVVAFTEAKNVEDCINIAISNYIPIQVAQEQEKLAQLRVREARRSFYPSFLGEWKEMDGKTVTEPYRGRSYGIQAQQPVFTGGRLMSTLRKEQLGELIARGNLERLKQDLIFKVSKAYYELVVAKKGLDCFKELKEKEEKLLNDAELEFKIEAATPAVLPTAQSIYNQICFQVASTEREYQLAILNLEKEMYVENLKIDNLNYEISYKRVDINFGECKELAVRNRPEPRIIEMTIKSAEYGENVIKSEEMPNVTLTGKYGRSGEAFSESDLNLAKEWSLMGSVKWFLGGNTLETSYSKDRVSPFRVTRTDTSLSSSSFDTKFSFWDNLAHFTKQKEAQITRKQAEQELADMRNKISQETQDAYYSYIKYNTQFSLALNEIGYRRKQLEITKAKREMGDANAAEVMEAQMRVSEAEVNLEQAKAGIVVAIVSLNRAIGLVNYIK